ncbi:TadE family type IV pilus minor pilin [Lacisediminihabitans profunda]|uniref:TadE family type IV pilus minor pilin n=1 Tax=Lacisediminihabitans profunda TaxID=2594790 RepID=UPI001FE9534E|nr:TadE family type IV pilus minor pilin [Lacisediminihabitans profunda]
MTAEFAVVIPAVVLVLGLCLSGLQLAGAQLMLQQVAASAARALARGEDLGTAGRLAARLAPGAMLSEEGQGSVVCVRASSSGSVARGLLGAVSLSARSCALAGGR